MSPRPAGAPSPLQLDTGNAASFADFAQRVRSALAELGAERFDFLVNNAGTSHHGSIEETTEADLDGLYNVHFKGVFLLTQTLLPLINDGGRIVNLSSGLTRIIVPGSAAYGALKGAVEVLTRYMAKELGAAPHRGQCRRPPARSRPISGGGMVRDNPDVNRRVSEMTALGRPRPARRHRPR